MASIESNSPMNGKLIALEGDFNLVSTQLHLLPPSQKILVLPSLLETVPERSDSDPFDARSFVKSIYDAYSARTNKARSFLEQSSSTQPRLVFTNGGSVSARAICIARLAENVPNGNLEIAEEILDDIVKDGVAGLTPSSAYEKDDSPERIRQLEDGVSQEINEDPTSKAMKAAESLDQIAANLGSGAPVDNSAEASHGDATVEETETDNVESVPKEVSNDTNEGSAKARVTRTSKVPVQEFIFTAPKGEEIRRTVITLPKRSSLWSKRSRFSAHIPQLSELPPRPCFADVTWELQSDDEFLDDFDIASPGDDTFPSTPVVVYGEACLVDIHSAEPEIPLRRARSADRLTVKVHHLEPLSSSKSLKHSTSHHQLRPRNLSADYASRESGYFQTLPRTTFVRASQTTIRRSPTTSEAASSSAVSLKEPSTVFVDRGTDADEIVPLIQAGDISVSSFEPVFPLSEDLIINFHTRGSQKLFEKVIAGYKNGSYPLMVKSSKTEADDSSNEIVMNETAEQSVRPISDLTVETDDVGFSRRHTYDPYANYPDSKTQWALPSAAGRERSNLQMQPPTPCMTPPPSDRAEKFVDFSPGTATNAISLQDSLRQILSVHFPSTAGFSQHLFPAPSEMERLWKPVFRADDSGEIGEEGRTVDQIVALGCESGVDKIFFAQMSGQIEKLGYKRTGLNRSGKLDIRYLISNVMQGLPLDSAVLSEPVSLAVLIIPQLEAYLASNAAVRFLVLHYTPEHLATVLALQSLLGNDLFKVAGVLDSLASDPPSFSRPRTPQVNPLSNEATLNRPSSRRAQSLSLKQQLLSSNKAMISKKDSKVQLSNATASSMPSFSKADYLLPSTATDTEITTFLSTIWKPLMEKSSFYVPDPEPKTTTPPLPTPRLPTPKTPTSSHGTSAATFRELRDRERAMHAGEVSYPPSSFKPPKSSQSTVNDKASRLLGQDRASTKYAPSIASTVRTTASERGRREDRAWENFYIAEEDSEDDDFDKMILGRGYARIVPEVKKPGGKRPTKKALKWLGLA